MTLSALKVEKAICPQDKKKLMLSDGDGLFLRVRQNGSKHWFFRFTFGGKVREQCLGAYPDVSLSVARDLRDASRALVKQGKDPILEASNQKADNAKAQVEKAKAHVDGQARARTLRQVADEYTQTDKFRKSMSEGHAKQWKSQVGNHLYPHFDNGNAVVADITSKHCVQSLKAVWSSNPKTAKNLRERLEKIIGYAIWKGYRDGPNPAIWADNLEHEFALPKGGNHPALPFEKVADFLESLRTTHDARVDAFCLAFIILTAWRSGEARKATWAEVLDEKGQIGNVWKIPAAHTKRKREHVVPLSRCAIALLNDVRGKEEPDKSDPIFRTKRGLRLPHGRLHTLCRRLNSDITIHGFRSTFRDWVGEETDFDSEAAEFCLAHVKRGTEGAYRRQESVEKRRRIMQAWGLFCDRNVAWKRLAQLPRDVEAEVIDIKSRRPSIAA
jgi:integrase